MDVPVVLSHKTAWLFYHAPNRAEVMASERDYGVDELGLMPRQIGERVRRVLLDCGIPREELGTLDVITSFASDRSRARGFSTHALGSLLTADHVVSIVPGLMVVNASLCFLQAATWMSYLELVEFGYELCGDYEVPLHANREGYIERNALCSRAEILGTVGRHEAARGAKLARQALLRVKGRSRSPMETAVAMAIVLPKKLGGLGYRSIELNRRIDVPPELRYLSSSTYYELDLYAEKARYCIEYNGGRHEESRRQAHDAERADVLGAMKITVQVLTKGQFVSQLAFHRAFNTIARNLDVRLDPTPAFQRAQNELRQFLIRGWNAER